MYNVFWIIDQMIWALSILIGLYCCYEFIYQYYVQDLPKILRLELMILDTSSKGDDISRRLWKTECAPCG